MSKNGLIIRRNERHEVSLPARARVSFSHADKVKFSKGAGGQDGWMDVHLIDFSDSGLGMVSTRFFPRGSVIDVVVPDPAGGDEAMIQCSIRVMRVQMTDRRPAYMVGGLFNEPEERLIQQIDELLDRLTGEDVIGGEHA